MKRSSKTILLLGGLVISLMAAGLWLSDRRENIPTLRGETLDYWLKTGRLNSSQEYQAAIAEMDDECVQYLIQKLEWSPPTIRIALNKFLARIFHRSIFSEEIPDDLRSAAADALGRIGIRAQVAIQPLREAVARGNISDQHSLFASSAAVAALIRLGADNLDGCVDKIVDAQNTNWKIHAYATLFLSTNASSAVPRLVKAFEASHDENFRGRIAIPLRFIRSEPELSVPVLAALTKHSDRSVRFNAVAGIEQFDGDGKLAWKELSALLNDQTDSIRKMTTNAMRKIDPQEAKHYGIE